MFNEFALFYSALLLWICTDSMILRGQLITRENWAFLARFCFLSEKGRFRYDFITGQNSNINLLLYYDNPDQWPSVYPSNKTCLQRQRILSSKRGQVVPLSTRSSLSFQSGCSQVRDNGTELHCSSSREFLSSRPRWWFMALADCSSQTGLNVTYWISLTNGSPGDFWHEHFSADEFYILPELIIAACTYAVLLFLSFYVALELRSRRLLHVSYKLFIVSVFCQLLGVLLESSSYTSRALRGFDAPRSSLYGRLLESCAETLYTVLMLLLALGYTVTKSVLSSMQTRNLIWFVCISVFFQLSLFIYQSEAFDPGLVLYIYESPPGYALLALKLLAWFVFVACCFRTCRKTATKIRFYIALISLGSSWFLCQPLMVHINLVYFSCIGVADLALLLDVQLCFRLFPINGLREKRRKQSYTPIIFPLKMVLRIAGIRYYFVGRQVDQRERGQSLLAVGGFFGACNIFIPHKTGDNQQTLSIPH